MGREIRLVKQGWEHPRYADGGYKPLLEMSFKECLDEWEEGKSYFDKGLYLSYDKSTTKLSKEEIEEGFESRPSESDFMPQWKDKEKTHMMMYEDCTEGTPISPVFKIGQNEELAQWLADNKASTFGYNTATKEQWLNMINAGGWAVSGIISNGKMMSGVEYYSEGKDNEN